MITKSQEEHLDRCIEATSWLMKLKYRKGALEHKGDIRDLSLKQLLKENINEHIDGLVYCLTALEKIEQESRDNELSSDRKGS